MRSRHPSLPRWHGRFAVGRFALACLACVWLAGVAVQAATLKATLERQVVGLGDTVALKVILSGAEVGERPQVPSVDGLRIGFGGESTSISIVNLRQTITVEYSYAVTPTRIGDFMIGPITLPTRGGVLRAEPVALKVVAADDPAAARNDGLDKVAFLELVGPNRPIYVGEAFVVQIDLYATGGRLQQAPQLTADGFTVGKLQDGGQEGNIRRNNGLYTRARFFQTLTAARSGDLTLQAGNCLLDVAVGRRPPAISEFFDDAFFGLRETRRLNLSARPVTLKVLPLPTAGVPPAFNGAVGDFSVALTASPTNLQAGDPITVRVEIRGKGNFDALQLPDQPAWQGFRTYPPTAKFETSDPLGLSGTKQFEQVVTPENASPEALPPLVFAFFHPESGQYRTVRTPAVPLSIAAAAAAPVIPSTAVAADAGTNTPPAGLLPLKPHLGTVLSQSSSVADRPWFLALNLVPAVGWLGARWWRRRQERLAADHGAIQRRQLERRVDQGLISLAALAERGESEAFFAALFRLLQDAVALRTGQAPSSITEGAVDDELTGRGVPPEVREALHRLFQSCNQARYARVGSSADLAALHRVASTACQSLRQP